VEGKMVNELDNLIDQAFELAYHGRPEDKTKADMTKYLMGVMRFSPVQKVEQDILDNRLQKEQRNQIEAKEKAMSKQELIARINALALMEGEVLEAEIVEVVTAE
jgi:hypothetical protein